MHPKEKAQQALALMQEAILELVAWSLERQRDSVKGSVAVGRR